MTGFSDILSEYVKERKTNISALSATTGIDRTLLHKYISGKRIPSDIHIVTLISDGLMLSPDEMDNLCESFKITSLGEKIYKRNKNIIKIAKYLSDIHEPDRFCNTIIEEPIMYHSIYDNISVNTTIRSILSDKNYNTVSVISPPSYHTAISELTFAGIIRPELKIIHLITFSSIDSDYNLNIFAEILPLLVFCNGYTPLIRYISPSESENSFALFPNLILTKGYAFTFNNNFSLGIVHTEKNIIETYEKATDSIIEHSSELIDRRISSFPPENDISFNMGENFFITNTENSSSLIYRTGGFFSKILINEHSLHKVFKEFAELNNSQRV